MTKGKLKPGWMTWRFDQFAINVNDRIDDPSKSDAEYYVGLEHLDPESLKIRRWGVPTDVEATKLIFKKGDIILGRRRVYQRKLAVAEFDGICSAHAMVLRPRKDVVAEEFLPFFMQSDLFMERALAISVGSLSPTINWKTLAKQEFALPPLDEQHRIAELLQSIEVVNDAFSNATGKADILEQSYGFEMFLGETFLNLRTNNFAGAKSEFIKFKDSKLTIIDGDRGKAYPKRSQLVREGHCLFLNAKNVTARGFDFSDCEYIDEKRDGILRSGKLEREDVILTTRGTLGNVAYYDKAIQYNHLRINSGMVIFRVDPESLLPKFLYYYLSSSIFKQQIQSSRSGSAQPQLPIGAINEMVIPVLSIQKQKEIVGVISELHRLYKGLLNRTKNLIGLKKLVLSDLLDKPTEKK